MINITNESLPGAILEAVQQNHIWINAFLLIRPTRETYEAIGKQVVEMFKTRENLLPNYCGLELTGPITELQNLTPVLYLSINAS